MGLGFSIYLLGIARIMKDRFSGLVLVAVAESIILTTRWSHAFTLAVLLLPVLDLLRKRRAELEVWWRHAAVAMAVLGCTTGALLWYNFHRFSNPFETGYGLSFRQSHHPFFIPSQIPANIAALLLSPFRGFLWFCPAIVVLIGLRKSARTEIVALLWPYVVAACTFTTLLTASLSFWSGGFAWGPRYFMALLVLLAPFFASVFALGQRWRGVVLLSMGVQFCSVLLPSSAENFVYFMKNEASPGSCTPWSCDCSALCLRLPWSLTALANTALARPLPLIDSDSAIAPDSAAIIASSDYESVYWWPVRAAYRAHKLSPALALALCLSVLAAAAYALRTMYEKLSPE